MFVAHIEMAQATALLRLVLPIVASIALIWPLQGHAADPKRYAFVVTNQNHAPELLPLKYPHSDGDNVSAALKALGFEVRLVRDASKAEFGRQLSAFAKDLESGGPDSVAFFYFSGHCFPNREMNANFLIMNEAVPSARAVLKGARPHSLAANEWTEYVTEIWKHIDDVGIHLRDVIGMIARANATASFVVIDSHLDASEPTMLDDAIRLNGSTRSRGSLMFVTRGRPGLQAADNNDFSRTLAGALLTPGLDAQGVFKQMQLQVAELTNGKQIPLVEDRLVSPYRFIEIGRGGTGVVTSPQERQLAEIALWHAVRDSTDPHQIKSYLDKYPQGDFAEIANLRLSQLENSSPDQVGRRVALVVGNSRYKHLGLLPNPENDARALGQALRELGFDKVEAYFDADKQVLTSALEAFRAVASGASSVVVYYAGHGMEIDGKNYLVPTDASFGEGEEVESEAVPVSSLFEALSDAKGIKVIILDACRDNPFKSQVVARSDGRNLVVGKAPGRSDNERRHTIGHGLAKMEAQSGTLIALSADPGMPAFDGDGSNSPYASALLTHIREPGLEVRLMFGRVYDTMHEQMHGQQEPWIQAKLGGKSYFLNTSAR